MKSILIIDEDCELCEKLSILLFHQGYNVEIAADSEDGLQKVTDLQPDLVLLGLHTPGIENFTLFEQIHSCNPQLPVIIAASVGNPDIAIEAIQKGAFDFIYKPFDEHDLLQLVQKSLKNCRCCQHASVEQGPEDCMCTGHKALVGNSKQMLEVYKAIGRVSATNATVLIRGESGTGKELTSRAIYNHSARAEKPFIVINCVAIPETLLESELFGYEKGSFTGADRTKIGKVEQARGGTLFLDEIGDMALSTQGKLLRLLQENSIERIGGSKPINVDVRIIAATNRNLEEAVASGAFREDLYYRLRVVTITMPPLRQRKEDIYPLIEHLLTRLTRQMSIANPGITRAAIMKMVDYHWPGNIRELSNTLKKSLIFNRGAPIDKDDISFTNMVRSSDVTDDATSEQIRRWVKGVLTSGEHLKNYDFCVDHVASLLVREALHLTRGNRSKAARLLGISRPTLHAKIDKYHIDSHPHA